MADPDHALRLAANESARRLQQRFDDIVPLRELRFQGQRVSFGSFQRGIHRPREMRGHAALTLTTAPPVPRKPRPYDDELRAAYLEQVPLVYFLGLAPAQYAVVQPVSSRTTIRPRGW